MKVNHRFAVLDFETDPAKHGQVPSAFACGFFDGKLYEYFWPRPGEKGHNVEKLVLEWAARKVSRFDGLCYAHNGGRFDFLGYLFRTNPELLYGQRARLIGARIVAMKYGAGEIRDSYAILPSPLSSYDKGEIEDYQIFLAKRREKHREAICEYLKRDCTSLYSLVGAFKDQHGLKPLTAASAGMAAAKALGYDLPRLAEHQDTNFRQYYFGGRVQAFWTGCEFGSFHLYDIKSAYPHAMLSKHAACNQFQFIANPSEVLDTDFVYCKGFFRGCFPKRTETGLRYPHGEGEAFVTGWEYNEALRCGLLGKHTVNHVERSTASSDFKRYVEYWFGVKEEAERTGDRAGRLIAKIMLNALYGKYAQRPDRWREYEFARVGTVIVPIGMETEQTRRANCYHEKDGWIEEYSDETNGFCVLSQPSKRPPAYYNVATAASITGYVRARIMKACHEWPVRYTDTDSVICPQKVDTTGAGIGSWGLETEGDFFACAGKKLYALRLLPGAVSSEKDAKKKGYHWQVKPFRTKSGLELLGGRAWKIASKGCRMTPREMCKVAEGGEVQTFNLFPTFSLKTGVRHISRKIRKTA